MICLLQHRKSCLVQKEEKKAKADCKRWQTGAVVPVVVKVMQPAGGTHHFAAQHHNTVPLL